MRTVDQEWFDGLDVTDLAIKVAAETISCEIVLYDYLMYGTGANLEIENNVIIDFEYDGIL